MIFLFLQLPVNEVHHYLTMQAAFTAKELREVLRMEGIRVVIPRDGMQVSAADQAELKSSRVRKRVYDLLEGASQTPAPEYPSAHNTMD